MSSIVIQGVRWWERVYLRSITNSIWDVSNMQNHICLIDVLNDQFSSVEWWLLFPMLHTSIQHSIAHISQQRADQNWYPSIRLLIHLSIHPFCQSLLHPSICLPNHPSLHSCPSIHPSIYSSFCYSLVSFMAIDSIHSICLLHDIQSGLDIHVPWHLHNTSAPFLVTDSIHPPVLMSIHLSIHLFTHPSIHPSSIYYTTYHQTPPPELSQMDLVLWMMRKMIPRSNHIHHLPQCRSNQPLDTNYKQQQKSIIL